jgi:hypothetical protein
MGGTPYDATAYIVRGNVARWMRRSVAVAVGLVATSDKPVHIYGSNRVMGVSEFADVVDGMTENDYCNLLREKLYPQLIVHKIDSASGADVAATIATDHRGQSVGVCTVAGNWLQAAGQVQEAISFQTPKTAFGVATPTVMPMTLSVHTDSYPLGVTGNEPTATHQNPFSAIGSLLRSVLAAMKV